MMNALLIEVLRSSILPQTIRFVNQSSLETLTLLEQYSRIPDFHRNVLLKLPSPIHIACLLFQMLLSLAWYCICFHFRIH